MAWVVTALQIRCGAAVAVLAAAASLAACGSAASPGGGVDPGSPGRLIEVMEQVSYYPACGNEVLVVDGTSWFPVAIEDPYARPSIAALASGGVAGRGTSRIVIPAVAAPGPGDDLGTLTVYEGGLAFWLSNSGDLSTWLTTARQEYGWVC